MLRKLFEFAQHFLFIHRPESKNLWYTASLLTIVSLSPAIGILFFEWEGWMIIFNYYTELWILGIAIVIRNLAVIRMARGKKEVLKSIDRFGGIMIIYFPILIGIGILLVYVIPDELKDVTAKEGLVQYIITRYIVNSSASFSSFFTSPVMPILGIVLHHAISFLVNFYPVRKKIALKENHAKAVIAISRLFGMVMLTLISYGVVVFVHSSAVDLQATSLLSYEALMFPLTIILVKTIVDVRAHIRSKNLWIGEGFFAEKEIFSFLIQTRFILT